ncbi:DUF4962 domain-containing protein [Flavobacterium pectinovorum]|uniref:DUF4962 domain-containing protein n=1 Tax=Flavobacterium pectinovorum TaxID=29533 RepID=UPI001FAB4DD6|nr:DUF4962 domain-containing protein [Flavobacterium pectinovorum]MCI9845992.1 DUF4962 domain-containing protein [Flavobacterium pectinovorum]
MIKKSIFIVSLWIIALNCFGQQKSATIKLTSEKLHSRVREWPYPANGITVPTNAPALLWPATNGKNMVKPMESGSDVAEDPNIGNVRYKVMLASNKNFNKDLLTSSEQRWAVYPLHQSLKPGKWYWKYGYSLKGSTQWTWSPVYDFVIDAKYADQKIAPPISEVLKRNEGSHPLLWNMNHIGEDFYRNNLENPEAKKFIAYAEKLMLAPLPTEKPQRIIDTTGKNRLEKKILIERMYHGFGDFVGKPISNLCIAYQLTKDKRFILNAKLRALNIIKMNPDAPATGSDFNNGVVLEALGWFYDAGYDFLSSDEKEMFKKAIVLRAKLVYNHLPNRFEMHVSDNHVWQITMANLAIATVAVINDVPEAKEWLTYLYEVWTARFPVLGSTDGGWHEGNGYFMVNFRSIIYLSQMFGDFSGVNYFYLPWMQNLPYYLLYTNPVAAGNSATGDMWEKYPTGGRGQAWFTDALTYKMNNPYLNWYVNEAKIRNPQYFIGTDEYLLYRLLNYKPDRKLLTTSPGNLPKSRKFADVGVVAMYEDLANPDKSLSSFLLSNPFGSSGHGHASQNAFTINYKGKVIFGGAGYYSNFSDKHNLLDYRSSKAYNTILADSLNQKIGEEGYGWIPRAISGKHIQYALGDASNAYGEIKSDFWLNRFKQINVVPSKANGYGESGVTHYRRHMLQLDGGYIVLYDELEANKPVKWTTQFHTPYYTISADTTANVNQQKFSVKTDVGNVNASVFANSPLEMEVHDKFYEQPLNWNKLTGADGKLIEYVNQWHAGITSEAKQKFRYLTIIQVKDGKTEVIKNLSNANGLSHLQVGDWGIQVQLDGEKPAALQVFNKEKKSLFSYGNLPVHFNGKIYKSQFKDSSILLEMKGNKATKQEAIDELPDVAKYDKN